MNDHTNTRTLFTRRQLIRGSAGLGLCLLVPAGAGGATGCTGDPQTDRLILELIVLGVQVGLEVYRANQEITGELTLENSGGEDLRFGSRFDLIHQAAGQLDRSDYVWGIGPGERRTFDFGDLRSEQSGNHWIEILLGGLSQSTDDFSVSG